MYVDSETLAINAICKGTVIDHISCGQAEKILRFLKQDECHGVISLAMGLPSDSLGTKDILKIEGRTLTDEEMDQIAILSPSATINLIENHQVKEKMKLELPEKVENFAACPNDRCITNHETIPSCFYVKKRGYRVIGLSCHYCRKQFSSNDLKI